MEAFQVDAFHIFDKQWALVTAGTLEDYNTMTISWGGLGTLWSRPVATVYVKPVRYTYHFLEKNDWKRTTTLTILGRLEKKNFLKIDRELRMNRYTPLVKRQDYLDFATKYYLENVFSNSVKKLFAGLLDSKEITKEELLKELKEI